MSPDSPALSQPEAEVVPARETGQDREAQLRELGTAFRRVFRSLNRLRGRDTHLAGTELSQAQFELLIELEDRGELSAGDLASAARLAPGTVTQMLDHLAECGHVERDRSQTDRRVVVSRLTAQGRRALQAKREAGKGRWEKALKDIETEEMLAATRVLERLGEMLEETSAMHAPEASQVDPEPTAEAAQR